MQIQNLPVTVQKMGGGCWWGVLVLAAATTQLGLCLIPEPRTQQEGLIRDAVDQYNQMADGECLFKLLSDVPTSMLEEEEDPPEFAFMIKETECLKTDEDIDLEGCDYKEDGEVKLCALYPESDEVSENPKCVSLTKNIRIDRRKKPCRPRPGGLSALTRILFRI
ncbi:15 kDa protein B-like [Hyperolius riggenbachi]|uniref:15 kDa protein B-like n=1 Tax=Hyperolius riggenbachi TaxID=752182 RepID=UPI0035A3446B